MLWVALLLTIIGAYATYKLWGFSQTSGRLKFLGLTISAGIFFLMQLSVAIALIVNDPAFTGFSNIVTEWGQILCLAFILSALAIFIRDSKPVFAQFPMLYTALPLLIVFSYYLVKDTYALKNWLLTIYQGGAIIVALLMYAVYSYRSKKYTMVLTGTVLFMLSYLVFWYVPGVKDHYVWIWKLLLGGGIIAAVQGYENSDISGNSELQVEQEINNQ